jgi:hypothetical protein
MPRKHLFAVVVLLGAAAAAGLLAVTRTVDLGAAAATPVSNAQITAKTRSLDRLEASLRRSLAEQPPIPAVGSSASQRTVYLRSSAPSGQAPTGEREDEHVYEGEGPGEDD